MTKISAGSLSSNIPSECEAYLDFRIPPQISTKELLTEVKRIVKEYEEDKPMISVNVEVLDSCEPYEADRESLLTRSLSWAIRVTQGKPAIWVRKTGTGDMNLYGAAVKIPTVTYGVGDSSLDHTANECVNLKEYEDSIQILYKGIKRLTELHSKRNTKQASIKNEVGSTHYSSQNIL